MRRSRTRARSSARRRRWRRCARHTGRSPWATCRTGSSTSRRSAPARDPAATRMVALTNSGGEGGLVADAAESAGLTVAPLPADLADALAAAHPGLPPGNPVDYWAVGPAEELAPALARTLARPCRDRRAAARRRAVAALRARGAAGRPCGRGRGDRCRRRGRRSQRSSPAARPTPTPSRCARQARPAFRCSRATARRCAPIGALARWRPRARATVDPGDGTVPARARRRDRAPVGAREPRGARALRHRRTARARGLDARRGCRRRASARDVRRRQAPRARPQGARRRSRARLCDPRRRTRRGRAHRTSRAGVRGPARRHGSAVRRRARRADRPAGRLRHRRLARRGARARRRSPASHRSAEDEALALVRSSPALAQGLHSKDQAATASVLVALGRLAAHRPDVVAIDINPLRVSDGTATALDALIVLGAIDEETPWISG